jgi:hypothetical protein
VLGQRQASILTLALLAGCHLIGGAGDLTFDDGAGGDSSAGGGVTNGGGGVACEPDNEEACYGGPAGTEGMGLCVAGLRTCDQNGVFGPCVGEVVPAPEICGNDVDEDCDGGDTPLSTACLSDDGLVARYFIDSDDPATLLLDSAPSPVSLDILTGGGQPVFTIDGVGRGLLWTTLAAGGIAVKGGPAMMKLQTALNGERTATLEVLAKIASATTAGSLIAGVYTDTYQLSLHVSNLANINATVGTTSGFRWPAILGSASPPRVFHLVFDSQNPISSERLVMFINGVPIAPSPGSTSLNANEQLNFPVPPAATIGATPDGNIDDSINGSVFYYAVYSEALSLAQVQAHSEILNISSDGP